MAADIQSQTREPQGLRLLSEKQREVMDLALLQLTSKQIAIELGLSPKTIDHRMDSVRAVFGVATRREAVATYASLRRSDVSVEPATCPATTGLRKPDLSSKINDHRWEQLPYQPFPIHESAIPLHSSPGDEASPLYSLEDSMTFMEHLRREPEQSFLSEVLYGRFRVWGRLAASGVIALAIAAAAVLVISFGVTISQLR